jgi:GTP 3',8-cyclase
MKILSTHSPTMLKPQPNPPKDEGPKPGPTIPPLIDPYQRQIRYLRLSITDRCDLRCVYCMAEEMKFLAPKALLHKDEIIRLGQAFIALGVEKIRLTGGEPLVRGHILDIIRALGAELAHGRLKELTLTTNGTKLAQYSQALVEAGIKRINVSLDSLDAARYRSLTRWGDLAPVLKAIAKAQEDGLRIKINMVALKGGNDDEILPMLRWCGMQGYDLTLIEVMPMGDIGAARLAQYLPLSLIRAKLAEHYTLEILPDQTGGPARYVRVKELGVRLGFITPMTHNFCEACNRVRLSADGMLYLCLGQDNGADLRHVLRSYPDADNPDHQSALHAAIKAAIALKPKGHDFIIDRRHTRPSNARYMSATGG